MAKNIKFLYKKHISDTAPDMEKLWDRIEGQLENKTDKDQTQIKVSRRNYRKFAAAAASLVLIIGGVSLYADIRSESDSVSKLDILCDSSSFGCCHILLCAYKQEENPSAHNFRRRACIRNRNADLL